jgi:uncharacterized protein (TIGR03083 family)
MMESQAKSQEIIRRINEGWEQLQAFLASLSDEEMTVPTDAAGWTVKDHLMHMAVWEDGIEALLTKESRIERMGVTEELWEDGDVDTINAVIQQAHKDKSLEEVRQAYNATHERFVKTVAGLSDEALHLPYNHYEPSSDDDRPALGWIVADSYEHYEEHLPWMKAIAEKA